ncbi:MAG: hypothetical protein IT436_15520 [Phycisphaerales bacterium]|nr:hypothetical protein [Phycisphaerales bacterium]
MKTALYPLGSAIAALALTTPAVRADVIADSVADFAGVQGANGWFYGLYNLSLDVDHLYTQAEFAEMSLAAWNGSVWQWPGTQPPYVSFNPWACHPDGVNREEQHHAIRRWVSTVDGEIIITGRLAKWDTRSGDGASNGTIGVLIADGIQLLNYTLAWDDSEGVSYEFPLTVQQGSIIDLCVDANGVDYFDGTMFTMTVTQVPGPATLAIAGMTIAFAGRRRR